MGNRTNWGVLLVALGAAMWGLDAIWRPVLLPIMSSQAIVFAEHLVLAVYAIPAIALGWTALRRLRLMQWGALLLIGWGASGLATVLFTEGFRVGDPTTVILLQKAQPLFAIVLARLALGERLSARYWPVFGLAMAGAYLGAFGGQGVDKLLDPIGKLPQAAVLAALYALGAALLWGAGTVLGRYVLADVPFHTLTGLRFLLAMPFLAVLVMPQQDPKLGSGWEQVAAGFAQAPVPIILVSLIPGLLGLLLYYRGLQRTPASLATLAELAFPFTAILVGWLWLRNPLPPLQLVGFGLLWLALILLTRIGAVRQPTPTAEPVGAATAT
ncbi:MAG: DMT family transporter [Chloroflexi bacterium]|nr:DMT family transporter [Chloroflexota bacterium]